MPIRDIWLNDKLQLSDAEIATLSPLHLPPAPKPLVIAYGSVVLPALVVDSRDVHALRAAAQLPGVLIPLAGTNQYTKLPALSEAGGLLTRQLQLLV